MISCENSKEMLHEHCAVYVDACCFYIKETSILQKISVEKGTSLDYYYVLSPFTLTTRDKLKLHLWSSFSQMSF